MKYFFSIVLIFVLTLNAFSQTTYYVTADNGLYAREAPDRGSKAIAKLSYGTAVEVLKTTDLKMDIKDGNKVVSGNWVKVRTSHYSKPIEAYVFSAYLTNKELEPRTVVVFEPFDLEVHDLTLHEAGDINRTILKDSANFFVELGDSPENKTFRVKPNRSYKKIELYQAVETSLTVSDEGPHCDLINWKHSLSSWMPLERIDKTSFKSIVIDSSLANDFPEVSEEEILTAVKEHCGDDWVEVVETWKKSGYKAYGVSVSTIFFKVIMTDLDNNKVEKIVAVEIPMGC